jgi:hypothetical protein
MAQQMRSNEGGGKEEKKERKKDQFAKRAIDT